MSTTPHGRDLFGNAAKPKSTSVLGTRFLAPPFTVLDARSGEWRTRKQSWLRLGIESELGRKDDMLAMGSLQKYRPNTKNLGVSVFDPCLCEIMYKWFCPGRGQIIDPFAGGSVRGVVAHMLGFQYWGCDLRGEQVLANIEQGKKLLPGNSPAWVCGDAQDTIENAPRADFSLACPPYGSLEEYSNDPRDLSNMPFPKFMCEMETIIEKTCERLKNNRFACMVVGDFRDDKGRLHAFPGRVIQAFGACGLYLYNDIILISPIGTLPLRAEKTFTSRKLGRSHQYVLVFVKGDPEAAARACKGSYQEEV